MKKTINWLRISSVLLVLLGIIHVLAFVKVAEMFSDLSSTQFSVFSFMYLATGVGTLLPGIVALSLIPVLNGGFAWRVLLVCATYSLVVGLASAWYMPHNPFAVIYAVVGISQFLPTILLRKNIK